MPRTISILGGLLVDYILSTPHFPRLGESLDGNDLQTLPGGKGGNVAVACARLAGEKKEVVVKMFGAVGNDSEGRRLVEGLRENGVQTEGIKVIEGEKTGLCFIFLTEGGESGNVAYPGANRDFRLDEEEEVEGELVCLNLAQISLEKVVLPLLEKSSGKVLLNASPAQYLVGIEREKWCRGLKLLVLNESEAQLLGEVEDVKEAARKFLEAGVANVIITLGGEGAYFATNSGEEGVVEGEKVGKVVDTTGAGDCFLGAFAVEYVLQKEWDIRKAIGFACRAAAKSVQRVGCQGGMPYRDEIE